MPLDPPVAPLVWQSGMFVSKQVSLAEQLDMFAQDCAAAAISVSFLHVDIELENAEQLAQIATVATPALALLHLAQYWLQTVVRFVPDELELLHPAPAKAAASKQAVKRGKVRVEMRIDRSWFSVKGPHRITKLAEPHRKE